MSLPSSFNPSHGSLVIRVSKCAKSICAFRFRLPSVDAMQYRHCKSLSCKSWNFNLNSACNNSKKSTSQARYEAQLTSLSIPSTISCNKHKHLTKLNGSVLQTTSLFSSNITTKQDSSSSNSKIQNSIFHEDGIEMGNHYEEMIVEDPRNPMLLRNYGHYLLQFKGDLIGAEKCYLPALLLEPDNGQFLSEYAAITWKLYGAKSITIYLFERAVNSSPDDSFVHAAYARFLFEIEDDEE